MAISDDKNRLFVDTENNKGITLWEVAQCLRDYRVSRLGRDVGILCTSPNINKWALHKPVRLNSVGALTIEQRKSVRCGLQAVAVSKILTQSIGRDTSSSTTYTKEECLEEVIEWPYFPPRGVVANSYQEWFRLLDFDGYEHKAIAPDGGWQGQKIDADTINDLSSVALTVTSNGAYAGYNFKLRPTLNGSDYNKSLYVTYSIKFGDGSGEGIKDDYRMEIPIEYIASIDGYWRICLAVWCPNFGNYGGWGFFASRMTIKQYFDEGLGAGQNLENLHPDLATNPFVASLMRSYITSQGGNAEFSVVPLLVKNLGYTYTNGQFMLRAISEVTEAYCMPSGANAVTFECGTEQMKKWFEIRYTMLSNVIRCYIKNTDPDNIHSFDYTYTIRVNGQITSTGNGTLLLDPLEESLTNGGAPSGGSLDVVVTHQDGEEVQ